MPDGIEDGAHWVDLRLDVSRVDQKKRWFCGAACAEMVLEHFGREIDQSTAYAEIHDRDRFQVERLYSDPLGIVSYVNRENDQTSMVDVIDIAPSSDAEVLDDIFRVLLVDQTPVMLLALGGDHWVVVDGVRYKDSLDGNREYAGFYIQNPWKGTTPSVWVEVEEFEKRWVQPNKFGVTWLNKLIIIANPEGRRELRNAKFAHSKIEAFRAGPYAPRSTALSLVQGFGFQDILEIAGGGAIVSDPLPVINEDDGSTFHIVPFDAIQNREFGDFVYVVIDDASEAILEISGLSNQLDVPTDEEALILAQEMFPGTKIEVDPSVYWKTRLGAVTRTDVYKKIFVDGELFYGMRDGRLLPRLEDAPTVGG